MDIFSLKIGDFCIIVGLNMQGGILKRLNSLGFEVGKKIQVLSFSLFKSAVLLGCGSIKLGIRKDVATLIEVQKC